MKKLVNKHPIVTLITIYLLTVLTFIAYGIFNI
jgi:hypothetical protein